MKRVLPIIRLLVEAISGLICLLLVTGIGMDALMRLVIGFLGMPRGYHLTKFMKFYFFIISGGLVEAKIALLICVFCLVDGYKIAIKLRGDGYRSRSLRDDKRKGGKDLKVAG